MREYKRYVYISLVISLILFQIDRDDPNANPFKAMRDIQQDIGCHLSYASDAIVAVTQSILKRIEHAKAKVESISRDQNKWSVKLSDGVSISHFSSPFYLNQFNIYSL